ncbi:hypothetical protein [Ekhidna sp.]|uniref:hypothetical protein n=1 Tax=Ekhidna sp. TaxID=2608089 RepID=UPI0032EBCB5F
MKSIKSISLIAIAIQLMVMSCTNKNKETSSYEDKMDQEAKAEYLDPDNLFADAITRFENGDLISVKNDIEEAIVAMRNTIIAGDTVHAEVIEFAISDLQNLSDKISTDGSVSPEELRGAFASADGSLGMYNLLVIEDWVLNEQKNKETLQRMHTAIVRTQYAINHANLPMSEEEKQELAQAKQDVAKAEQADHTFWKNLKKKLSDINRRLEENENPMDGSGL